MTGKNKKETSSKIKLDVNQIKADAGKEQSVRSHNSQSGIISLKENSISSKELFTKDKK